MEVLTLQAPSKWGGQILHRTGSTVPRLQRSQCGHAMSPHCCAPICMRHDVLIHSSILGQHGTGAQTDPPHLEQHRVCLDTSQLCHWLLSLSFQPYLFTRHVFRAQSDKEGRSAVGCPLKHCPLPLCRAALSPRDRLSPPRALQVTLRSVLPPPGAVGQEEEMTW